MPALAWPLVLLLAPLPWIVRRLLPPDRAAAGAVLRVPLGFGGGPDDASARRPPPARRRPVALVIWGLLLIAGARPQWLGDPVERPVASRDLLIAVDLSRSMGERDFELEGRPVSRLALVKAVAGDFISRREGDRIGLILFGARAYLQTPLTFDRRAVAGMLAEADVGLAGNETAIGDAIGLAIKRLRRSASEKVMVLLTDGANTAGTMPPERAASLAKLEGLRVHTIGLGTPTSRGARIPEWARGMRPPDKSSAQAARERTSLSLQLNNLSRDLNEPALRAIASATGGRYFRATDRSALERIYRTLDEIEPVEQKMRRFQPAAELFRYPLGAALVLSLWASHRRPRRSREDG